MNPCTGRRVRVGVCHKNPAPAAFFHCQAARHDGSATSGNWAFKLCDDLFSIPSRGKSVHVRKFFKVKSSVQVSCSGWFGNRDFRLQRRFRSSLMCACVCIYMCVYIYIYIYIYIYVYTYIYIYIYIQVCMCIYIYIYIIYYEWIHLAFSFILLFFYYIIYVFACLFGNIPKQNL